MKLVLNAVSCSVDLELTCEPIESSRTVGNNVFGHDRQDKLVRILIGDPSWTELPKVELEGFKMVSFQMGVFV